MTKLSAWKRAGTVFVLCAATAIASPAQTFTTLVDFDLTNGAEPQYVSLVQGHDGAFYGTTYVGGANDAGTVFKTTRQGTLSTLYSFCIQANCSDGAYPTAGLVLASDGNFYGTTFYGGNGAGTIFRITPQGTLTSLYSFCPDYGYCRHGERPAAGLVQATDGNLYGTTEAGGGISNGGTIFRMTLEGTLTTIYTFCSLDDPYCQHGSLPIAGLIQGTDGNLYGTTTSSGHGGYGTVFKLAPGDILTTLHGFDRTDGSFPTAGLVQGSDGNLYGTTVEGGAKDDGTVFKVTPDGQLTTLHGFCAQPDCTDGIWPYGTLVRATDGNFYGTAYSGGYSHGTIFKIGPDGTLTTVQRLAFPDGSNPSGGLLQGTDGILYGTTYDGGTNLNVCTNGCGTVFSLETGLGPFVTFVHAAGKVGQTGPILGQGFTGTTNVSLNGVPATFTVVSDTFIRATVPVGATTGFVTVTTPSGTLTSNVPFQVIP